jgi:hypothetical protein
MTLPDLDDRWSDPFHPPRDSVEVGCLHCGQTYQSDEIVWRLRESHDGLIRGYWVCPVEGCGGAGFGFDIFPTDPHYRDERGGWVMDDENEADWDPDDDSDTELSEFESDNLDFKSDDSDSDVPF